MGGFIGNLFSGGGGGDGNFAPAPPPQFAPTQYSNPQIIDYARLNNGNTDLLNQYNAELVSQLRNKSYENPYSVWQKVRTAQDKAAFDAANPPPQQYFQEEPSNSTEYYLG